MTGSRTSMAQRRRSRPDLLGRAPSNVGDAERAAWAALVVDPVAQVRELDDLVGRGLLSREEFERLKARIVSTATALSWPTSDGPSPPPRRER